MVDEIETEKSGFIDEVLEILNKHNAERKDKIKKTVFDHIKFRASRGHRDWTMYTNIDNINVRIKDSRLLSEEEYKDITNLLKEEGFEVEEIRQGYKIKW